MRAQWQYQFFWNTLNECHKCTQSKTKLCVLFICLHLEFWQKLPFVYGGHYCPLSQEWLNELQRQDHFHINAYQIMKLMLWHASQNVHLHNLFTFRRLCLTLWFHFCCHHYHYWDVREAFLYMALQIVWVYDME